MITQDTTHWNKIARDCFGATISHDKHADICKSHVNHEKTKKFLPLISP